MVLKILFIEPFFGGSHKHFAEGLKKNSSHKIDLVTMPGCNWNWRVRGAALYFSKCIDNIEKYDGIITTNLMRLSDFKVLIEKKLPPVMVYFHENQLTYPLAPKEKRNAHLCMSDVSTALCADRVLFNSSFHEASFFNAVSEFTGNVPDYSPDWVLDKIKKKSGFIYPGCCFDELIEHKNVEKTEPPLIIWNHRWSYDKNARSFFHALGILMENDIDFRLVVLGENSGQIPDDFINAKKKFKDKIVCYGFVRDRKEYIDWLKKGDVVVSTAIQENFGIAIVEAMRYGCIPLLPDRLSYPEILPEEFHPEFLYKSQRQLIEKLTDIILKRILYQSKVNGLDEVLNKYSWENIINLYDDEIDKMVRPSTDLSML